MWISEVSKAVDVLLVIIALSLNISQRLSKRGDKISSRVFPRRFPVHHEWLPGGLSSRTRERKVFSNRSAWTRVRMRCESVTICVAPPVSRGQGQWKWQLTVRSAMSNSCCQLIETLVTMDSWLQQFCHTSQMVVPHPSPHASSSHLLAPCPTASRSAAVYFVSGFFSSRKHLHSSVAWAWPVA